MTQKHQEQDIRRYLLGDSSQSEEEKTAIEQSYLRDDAAHKNLLEIEDELVDAYVFGRLDSNETALFKKSLRDSPRWQQKVELATSLRQYASRSREAVAGEETNWWQGLLGGRPGFRLAAACAVGAAVIVSALSIYYLRTQQMDRPTQTTATTKQPSSPQTAPRETRPVEQEKSALPRAPTTPVFSFILTPDLVRGNGEQTIVPIPRGRYEAQLRMRRGNEPYIRYEATLSTPERRIIAHDTNLSPNRSGKTRTVTLTLLSKLLSPGVYILNLKGVSRGGHLEDLDDYTFQVPSR